MASAVLSLILGSIFGVSGASKLARPGLFRAALRDTYRFPRLVIFPLSFVVPVAEIGIGGLILYPATRTVGLAASVVALVLISAVVTNALVSGRRGDCGCFVGLASERLGLGTIARSVVLLCLTLVAVILNGQFVRTPEVANIDAVGWVALAGLGIAAIAVALSQTLQLAIRIRSNREG